MSFNYGSLLQAKIIRGWATQLEGLGEDAALSEAVKIAVTCEELTGKPVHYYQTKAVMVTVYTLSELQAVIEDSNYLLYRTNGAPINTEEFLDKDLTLCIAYNIHNSPSPKIVRKLLTEDAQKSLDQLMRISDKLDGERKRRV